MSDKKTDEVKEPEEVKTLEATDETKESTKKVDWKWLVIGFLMAVIIILASVMISRSANKAGGSDGELVTPTPTATITVTPTPTPTATPSTAFALTKSPTNEVRWLYPTTGQSDGDMLFVAKATNYTSVTWYINGVNASNFNGVYGQGTQTLTIKPYIINSYKAGTYTVYAVFSNGYTSLTSGTATATIYSNSATQYSITTLRCDGGSVSASCSKAYPGEKVSISFSANSGYLFDYFTVNGEIWYDNYFYMPNGSVNVGAVFSKETTTYTFYLTEYGDTSAGTTTLSQTTALAGQRVYFTITPFHSQASYDVKILPCNTGDDIAYSTDGINYSFIMPSDDVQIMVYWTIPETSSEESAAEEPTILESTSEESTSEESISEESNTP